MTAPRTAGSPVLRSALAAGLCNAEAVMYEEKYRYADFDEKGQAAFLDEADRLLAALDQEAVVAAFAAALRPHEWEGEDGPSVVFAGDAESVARNLVAALLGDGS